MSTKIISEIGINHNGDIDVAKKLIDISAIAGCDYVKFQKRSPELCVPDHQKDKPKRVPWREKETTYLQYKKDIEFDPYQYSELWEHATEQGVKLFASVWDKESVGFLKAFSNTIKIPSACITDLDLLAEAYDMFHYKHCTRIMSTGMSTEEEIEEAVKVFDPHVIFHTNAVYPSPIEGLNLGYINWLKEKYPSKEIGYSNHYYGIVPMFASVAMGCTWVEFHATLNHDMWGSDQASSIEPAGIFKLVKGIRDIETAISTGNYPRALYPGEEKKRETLRR